MLKAVFFDLDGTLLPMDQDEFMKAYFSSLSRKMALIGYDPKLLIKSVWHGSEAMINNDGSQSNEQVFWEAFNLSYGKNARADEDYFNTYYVEDFDMVAEVCKINPAVISVISTIKNMGLRLALATNPLFPSIATEKRVAWTGLDISDFEIVTTYENSRFCKPNLKYYQDILQSMGLEPEEVLMVGNDVSDDMVVSELGMKVFLITDYLINKDNKKIDVYPNGTFEDLAKHIKTLI